jgi:hypothetical protein
MPRHRSHATLAAAGLLGLLLAGCRCGAPGPAPVAGPATPAAVTTGQTVVLATLPAEAGAKGEAPATGLGLHTVAVPGVLEFFFAERGGGVVYTEETSGGFHVVRDGKPGKTYASVGKVALSPDGRRWAHGALRDGVWHMVLDGQEGQGFSSVQVPVFSPDGAHVAYLAMAGDRWHLVVDTTVSEGTRTRYLARQFSGDSKRIAWIDDARDDDSGRLVVSDLSFKARTVIDAHASDLVVSSDLSAAAAVSASGGKRQVLRFAFDRPSEVWRGPKADSVSGLVLSADGKSLAWMAERGGRSWLALDDAEAPAPPGVLVGLPVIRPDRKAVGLLVGGDGGTSLHQAFLPGWPGEAAREEAEGLVYAPDGQGHAYTARRGEGWFVVADGQEGPAFDRVVSLAYSPDGKHLVYRARKDGKRFVVVADRQGKTLRQHASYEQVFPVRFLEDGRSIGYGVKDGLQLAWKVEAL